MSAGVALPQHPESPDPERQGIEHLRILSSVPDRLASAMLLDVRDLDGSVYVPGSLSRTVPGYAPYFRELVRLAADRSTILYFGVPLLHDAASPPARWLQMTSGRSLPGRLCPSSVDLDELDRLFGALDAHARNARIFLPFARYPPLSRGTSCACDRCRSAWSAAHDGELSDRLLEDPDVFARFLRWRADRLTRLIEEVTALCHRRGQSVALEVDLEPERRFSGGALVHDGQDVAALAQVVDEIVFHLYDRSPLPTDLHPPSSADWAITTFDIAQVRAHGCRTAALFWQIKDRADLDQRLAAAERLGLAPALVLLYADALDWIGT